MTFSIVVRETYRAANSEHVRFGVGVTTNNPGIGVFCPSVSERGAVAAQYMTYGDAGPRIVAALDDGRPARDVVPSVLDGFDRSQKLQIHALCSETRAVHHGESLDEFHDENGLVYGDCDGENYSVAGNCLANLDTLTATGDAYRRASSNDRLAARLITALEAGDAAGGDGRDTNARSAAIKVVDPGAGLANEWYNDLRVDASPTPLEDLRSQYELATDYYDEVSDEW